MKSNVLFIFLTISLFSCESSSIKSQKTSPAMNFRNEIKVVETPNNLTDASLTNLKVLYPEPEVKSAYLPVDGAEIYYEEAGNPNGIPVVFVHGGPGAQFYSRDLTFFNPEKYRIIAFDQRGCGLSLPNANDPAIPAKFFKDITIDILAEDMESLRKHLKIDKWLVFGGSWGSTLSLFYSQEYPEKVEELVLRGIFLCNKEQVYRYFDEKALKEQIPDWSAESLELLANYANSKGQKVELNDSESFMNAYYNLCILQNDYIAMYLWVKYEDYIENTRPENLALFKVLPTNVNDMVFSTRSKGIFEPLFLYTLPKTIDLLKPQRIQKLRNIKTYIVQGAKDVLCYPLYAEKLHSALMQNECPVNYQSIATGSHTPFSPDMVNALVTITDDFK